MKRVSKNLLSIALGDVGSRLVGFLAAAYLARTLNPDGFGLINLGFAFYGYLFVLANPGIQIYGARASAQPEVNKLQLVGDVSGLRLFLALLCTIAAAIISLVLIAQPALSVLVILYALSLYPAALMLDWFFQGKEMMQGIGWSRVLTNLVYLGGLLALVHHPTDVLKAPIGYFIGNIAGAAVLLALFRKRYGSLRIHWNLKSLFGKVGRGFDILKQSLPIGLGTIMGQLSYNFPPLLLGAVGGLTDVGYFAAALRVVFFLLMFDRIVMTVVLPAIARHQKTSPEQLQSMLSLVLKTFLCLVLPLCIGGLVVADRLMGVIFGDDFAGSAPVFQILMFYYFFSSSSNVFVYGLIGIGKERLYSKMMVWGTIVQMMCISLGTLLWGVVGAAGGYGVGEAVLFFLMMYQFHKFVRLDFQYSLFKPFAAAVMMGAVIFPIRTSALLITLPLGAFLFVVTLFALRGLTKDEITVLKAKLL